MKIFVFRFFLTVFLSGNSIYLFSQQWNSNYQDIVNQISSDSIVHYLKQVETTGIKEVSTPELSNAAQWLFNKYRDFGYTDIQCDTFITQGNTLHNIIVTKSGTTNPEKILIICGHYDSRTGPGVNDNGSGVSIILEIARLLKNVETENTIKFINFSGEEEGLWGSENYVINQALPHNQNIFLVFNIDEVGGIADTINNVIICEKDISNPSFNNAKSEAYTDTLSSLIQQYSSLQTEITFAYGSDYVPFQQAGFTITGLYEKNESPYIHSINDSLSKLDTGYVFQIAKASAGAALYFSKAIVSATNELKKNTNSFTIYPNPFISEFNISISNKQDYIFQVFNVFGKLLFSEKADKINRHCGEINNLKPEIYFYKLINLQNEKLSVFGKLCKIK